MFSSLIPYPSLEILEDPVEVGLNYCVAYELHTLM